MKKMFVLLTAVVITAGAWAKPLPSPLKNEKATAAFEKEFSGATHIAWSNVGDVSIVRFTFNNETLRAYFNDEGTLSVLQRDITSEKMTYAAAKAFHDLAEKQNILTLSEVNKEGDTYYLLSTEDNKYKTIYRINPGGTTSVIQKKKKK